MRERKLSDLTAPPVLMGTVSSDEGTIRAEKELSSKIAVVEYTGQCIANAGIRIGRPLYLTNHIKNNRILKR